MDRILQTLEAMEGLLTVQRAAELLVHQPQTLYKAIKSGRLPHVRTLGGSVRVDPDALASWLTGRGAR
jgi:excisionase family DNA binding protein